MQYSLCTDMADNSLVLNFQNKTKQNQFLLLPVVTRTKKTRLMSLILIEGHCKTFTLSITSLRITVFLFLPFLKLSIEFSYHCGRQIYLRFLNVLSKSGLQSYRN